MYIVLFHLYKVEEQAQVNNLGLRNARRGGKVTKKNGNDSHSREDVDSLGEGRECRVRAQTVLAMVSFQLG